MPDCISGFPVGTWKRRAGGVQSNGNLDLSHLNPACSMARIRIAGARNPYRIPHARFAIRSKAGRAHRSGLELSVAVFLQLHGHTHGVTRPWPLPASFQSLSSPRPSPMSSAARRATIKVGRFWHRAQAAPTA